MGNLYKSKLTGKSLGVIFGTFAPMHLGHYNNIMRAKRENDACLVVVSGYTGDRGDAIGLNRTKRFRYIRELFAEDENIYVAQLDESQIKRYPHGWAEWLVKMNQLKDSATEEVPERVTWYVGEPEYKEELDKRTNDQIVLLDRSSLPISASMIRSNPLKYWDYIVRTFRRHFSINILVMGSASTGKTTLVRDIARSFGSPYTDEYARTYEEESNVRDEELVANDFHYIASGQFDNNKKTIMSPSNNGMFFADTDVAVTKCYSKKYLPGEDHEKLIPFYDLLAEKEKWDIIIVIPPVTKYVDDQFRDMSHADEETRQEMHDLMMAEITYQGWEDKVIMLNPSFDQQASYDKEGFYARYTEARKVVKNYILDNYQIELP
ncbi:nicotinamide-nucleotide adenylyltransferase, NadR type [Amphibacillus marinus]|uniref:Nicotinamide-nucleotide adenylyltransferase, NadR type n=1 Tax=Amphibacillus marinus TaxID=872970 RepID=A0A1H8IUG8_9BACI|nr:AAA family ATPase [Amphibacillus marinus]SEN71999.1 nicotinamide-nucleotide adenylyltransferase, NadR type [Amphibacillus marinus]